MQLLHAYVDESARGADYYVCAAITVAHDAVAVRRLARSFLMPRQRRWHFTEEKTSRRRQILGGIVESGLVRAHVAHGKGKDVIVRPQCIEHLGRSLLAAGTERLVIESREGRDGQDRRVLAAVLRGSRRPFLYEHAPPSQYEGLWLADAVAWSFSAGGAWRDAIVPIVDREFPIA